MSVVIRETSMVGDTTAHHAERIVDDATPHVDAEHWRVTWLPGRVLTRNEAITAMTFAEIVQRETLSHDNEWWPFLDNWAAELDLTGPDAVARCSEAEIEVREAARRELDMAARKLAVINAKAGAR